MNTPNTPAENALSPDRDINVPLLIGREVAAAIRALGILDTIPDAQDQKTIRDAAKFLQESHASEDLQGITKHAANLAEVMVYMDPVPGEIDAMHEQLLVLQCQYHINVIKEELQQDSPSKEKIEESRRWACDIAATLAHPKPKGYGNVSLVAKLQELQRSIDEKFPKP